MAVRKFVVFDVYWLLLVVIELTKLKNVRKSQPLQDPKNRITPSGNPFSER